ncbi:MAG: glucosyl-3-phosphoglycerate synthase [Chitinispirillaceae bacterium]|nr:glucosyl-3-phosphoglycerate synthase [Chitinispirillaceae bacterium]
MIQTFKYEDFPPLSELTALKRQLHETISVVIPALNEESTIGPIVAATRTLKDTTGLVDEVIVMDDSSDDATASVAREAGAKVVHVGGIGPFMQVRGKGLALWKSQFVAGGSIIVFIDADLLDFNDRFIVGLAGALLHDKGLELVKAAYHRPFKSTTGTSDESGGRVTEILVRPLLNLFLAELAELRQPLAGEYAVRRSTLEKMHFYSGYGVEIGLLLEYYFTLGINSIGQVDTGMRTHRNRSLSELSNMAFEIGQVFFNYIEQQGYCTLKYPRNTIIKSCKAGIWKACECEEMRLPPKNLTASTTSHGT